MNSKNVVTLTGFKEPNLELPWLMHLDMNGFFASCEQQENINLRGKPVGVVPYLSEGSTLLAASYEAKALGISTGTKVRDAKKICPNIVLKLNDPAKYRYMHNELMKVLKRYTPNVTAKSIDEAVLDFSYTSIWKNFTGVSIEEHDEYMTNVAKVIKDKINSRVGDYMRCSVGIATNRFLAKVGSNINKPNGYYYLHNSRLKEFYDVLDLIDLHGVGFKIKARLNKIGIFTSYEFKNASLDLLRNEFKTFGYYWHLRLNGYEIDDFKSERKNVGHSYHIPYFPSDSKKPKTDYMSKEDVDYLKGIILKLTEKACYRLRSYNLKARCFSIYFLYKDNTTWHVSHRTKDYFDTTDAIYKEILMLFEKRDKPFMKARIVAISTSNFSKKTYNTQRDLFGKRQVKETFYKAIDEINDEYGDFTVIPATLLGHKNSVPDRIAFGK